MDEYIFGTLANDTLKLMRHRAARRGIQHQHRVWPRDPEPGQAIEIEVLVGAGVTAEQVVCYYTTDGSPPQGERGRARNGQVIRLQMAGVEWDTAAWGYVQRWTGTLPAQAEDTMICYQIGAWAGDGPEVYADWPEAKAASELAATAFFRGAVIPDEITVGDPQEAHTFTLAVDRLRSPQWAREAVIYHIFVDRFFPGRGRDWIQTDDLNGFCGGTLWGVAEKLDYVAELGANCIWLSPVFPSPSHHGYDVTDYEQVETRLGGDEALHHVVEQAHARGMRVILDIALNHLSDQHAYFQDALSSTSSPYRDWFVFDESETGYRAFFGVATMPQVNAANAGARQWLIDVGLYWLRELGVDGFRLDVADGPGPDFWPDFWTACKAERPDCFCFGEVVDAPDIQQAYIGRLDGVLDFHLCERLRNTYATKRLTEAELERFLERHQAYFPDSFVMPTFVDNHDMDRFIFRAGGDVEALKRAAARQMSLPNPPVIYYGTEIALTQAASIRGGGGMHINRVPMRWEDTTDNALLAYYRQLIRQRGR